jgi:hypothetical protein
MENTVLSRQQLLEVITKKEVLRNVRNRYIQLQVITKKDHDFDKLMQDIRVELPQFSQYYKKKMYFWSKDGYVVFSIDNNNNLVLSQIDC